MINDKCQGFTLIEILTVLIIIGIMLTGTAIAWKRVFGRMTQGVPEAAALSDMAEIRDAIVHGFYADFGVVPCDEINPQYASRYLCFAPDCTSEDIQRASYYLVLNGVYINQFVPPEMKHRINCEGLSGNCKELCMLLGGGRDPIKSAFTIWNKYYARGWRGSYVTGNSTLNASEAITTSEAYGADRYPPDEDGSPVYLPVIVSPWADTCERKAREAAQEGKEALAAEYRKGKYYQIRWGIRKTAHIFSTGADCLPGPAEVVRTCIAGKTFDVECLENHAKECFEAFEECKEKCIPYKADETRDNILCSLSCSREDYAQQCQDYCQSQFQGNKVGECRLACMDQNYNECMRCIANCAGPVSKLKITDPAHKDYVDIGDDILMFIFSGDVRMPLDR